MTIRNSKYGKLEENDLLICAMGYEARSHYLLEQNLATRNKFNTLVFCLERHEHDHAIFDEIEKKQIKVVKSEYNGANDIKKQLTDFIENDPPKNEMNIHFDYSSMPRSWYCSFPFMLSEHKQLVNDEKPASFWYVSGDYPEKYTNYPSAGIDSFYVFNGSSLPAVDIKRFHIIGLGYDNVRTETVITIIEPESLISCYAYNPRDSETLESARKKNKRIIDNSLLSVALPLDNFSAIVDKLRELVFNLTQNGQIVFVPDGPKPLIMAMSLVPGIVKKNGITCLHISRNNSLPNKVDVKPRKDEIYGFQMLLD
jgi:hypothetical protein